MEQPKGGAKASEVLGTISGIAGATGALSGIAAPIALPVAAVTGLIGGIVRLFGGNLNQNEVEHIMEIKRRVDARKANK